MWKYNQDYECLGVLDIYFCSQETSIMTINMKAFLSVLRPVPENTVGGVYRYLNQFAILHGDYFLI
jgi:hypothetical protein